MFLGKIEEYMWNSIFLIKYRNLEAIYYSYKDIGGLFYINKLEYIANFENTSFFRLYAKGSVIYIEECQGNLMIKNSNFISNF